MRPKLRLVAVNPDAVTSKRSNTPYPLTRQRYTPRPYRIWNAKAKAPVRWRYYSDLKRAHEGACKEVLWAKVGTVLEVYNTDSGRKLGEYKMRANGMLYTWKARGQ